MSMPRTMLPRTLPPPPRRDFPRAGSFAFMHVPKTAGCALTNALSRWAGEAPVFGSDASVFGGFSGFETFSPAIRKAVYLGEERPPRSAALVVGHMAASTLTHWRDGVRLLTVLREPRSRLLSHWLFWRGHSRTELRPWGAWGRYVEIARQPLAKFLSNPRIACQTDNIVTRMLLWPHGALPDSGFIPPEEDASLIAEAFARLDSFAFADVIENPALSGNLEALLGGALDVRRVNETRPVPRRLQVPLERELASDGALDLLDARSRLDRALWLKLMGRARLGATPERVAEQSFTVNVARHARLMAA